MCLNHQLEGKGSGGRECTGRWFGRITSDCKCRAGFKMRANNSGSGERLFLRTSPVGQYIRTVYTCTAVYFLPNRNEKKGEETTDITEIHRQVIDLGCSNS